MVSFRLCVFYMIIIAMTTVFAEHVNEKTEVKADSGTSADIQADKNEKEQKIRKLENNEGKKSKEIKAENDAISEKETIHAKDDSINMSSEIKKAENKKEKKEKNKGTKVVRDSLRGEGNSKLEENDSAKDSPEKKLENDESENVEKKANVKKKPQQAAEFTLSVDKISIAVFDLYTTFSADSQAAALIADRVRKDMINSGLFQVMERHEMNKILHKQTFQKFNECNSQQCMTAAGHLVGADRIVYGSVANVKGFYTIVLRMLNVPLGELLSTVTLDSEGDINSVISNNTSILVEKLLRDAGYEIKKQPTDGKKGVLLVDADREGSVIYIDGKRVDQKTPATLENISIGEHTIVARDNFWYGKATITLVPDSSVLVTIPMREGNGRIVIITEPHNAEISIDGNEIGKTQFTLENVALGEHEVVLEKEGYEKVIRKVDLDSAEVDTVSEELKSIVLITVKTKPAFAAVYFNNKYVGRGNATVYPTVAGTVDIRLEAPGYKPVKITANYKGGEKKTVEQQLEYLFGSLEIISKPPEVLLFINDEQVGVTPYKAEKINTGKYKISLIEDNYNLISDNIVVGANDYVKCQYALRYTRAYRDSLRRDRWTRNGYQRVRRLSLFALTIASSAAAGYFYQETLTDKKAYEDAYAEYQAINSVNGDFQSCKDLYNRKRESAERNRGLYYTSLSVGSGCFLGFCISIFF